MLGSQTLDISQPLTPHVKSVIKCCRFYFQNESRIWPFLTTKTSCLYSCNCLLTGFFVSTLASLQSIFFIAARVIFLQHKLGQSPPMITWVTPSNLKPFPKPKRPDVTQGLSLVSVLLAHSSHLDLLAVLQTCPTRLCFLPRPRTRLLLLQVSPGLTLPLLPGVCLNVARDLPWPPYLKQYYHCLYNLCFL